MTVSSGFFNSVNHDRLYDATQMSSIFDGIIKDGVYQGVGKALRVSAKTDSNNTVIIGSGRAWFDHTWTLNDSDYALVLDSPNEFLGRIDAIVLDVNREENTRKNEIKYLIGSFSSNPQKPELIKSTLHNQYPLAYITIKPGSDAPISDANIEICVGTDACPLVTGLLEVINSDVFMQQVKGEFNDWFNGIKDLIDENTALKLQNQIDEINNKIDNNPVLGVPQEAYDFATNYEVFSDNSTPTLFKSAYSDQYFLPDGYIVDFGLFNTSDTSYTGKGYYACAHIIDGNLSLVSSTLLQTLSSSDYAKSSTIWVVCEKNDSYPAKFKVFVDGSRYSTSSGNEKIVKYGLYLIDVTVSEDHIVSKTIISKAVSKNLSVEPKTNRLSNPVKLSDGTLLICTYCTWPSIYSRYNYGVCFFKISSESIVTATEIETFDIKNIGDDASLLLTNNEQYMILDFDGGNTGIYIQTSTLTRISQAYPPTSSVKEVKKPIGYSGYSLIDDKKYIQDGENINIENGDLIPFVLTVDNNYNEPKNLTMTPDAKFLFFSKAADGSYKYWYHAYIGFKKGFSVNCNNWYTRETKYSTPLFSPGEYKTYHDEMSNDYRYLAAQQWIINRNGDERFIPFYISSRGNSVYIIRRKES